MSNQAANEHILKIRTFCHCNYVLITTVCVSERVCTCFIHKELLHTFRFPASAESVCMHANVSPTHWENENLFISFHHCFFRGSRESVVGYTFFLERHQLPVLSLGPPAAIGDINSPTWPSKQQKRVLFLESILNTYQRCLEGCQV